MRKRKHRMQGALFWGVVCLFAVAWSLYFCGFLAAAEERVGTEVPYQVFFVDHEDVNTNIFDPQKGTVQEGTVLQISFPEQIVGSDGHIWNSLAESPQEFPVYQYGVHKYFISYQQGKKIKEEAETEGMRLLTEWCRNAWNADCAITGEDPEKVKNPYLVGENQADQDHRIRQLVSQIADADWHTFYLIGKNQIPQTLILGTDFDVVYSSVKEAYFSVEEDWYQVVRVRVKRLFRPERCFHNWECTSRAEAACLKSVTEHWRCHLCGMEEEMRLAPTGHRDPDHTGNCIQCGRFLDEGARQDPGEQIIWKEGEVQLRRLGNQVYRFVCVDEDYRDGKGQHRTAALFLCDSLIRADTDSSTASSVLFFGTDNNYKTSLVRSWLKEKSEETEFQLEPISVGVLSAYTGSTKEGSGAELKEECLKRYALPDQWITDRMFLLSVEEALRYRNYVWCFGTEMKKNPSKEDTDNAETQLSAYSQGYYLRTPYYEETEAGSFQTGNQSYVVDLGKKNIHPAGVDSETYGLRPAFALPQG